MSLTPYLNTHKAIIGMSGSGKSTTAREEVEKLLADNQHVVILDPTGVWWGIRSNAAGDGPGFDIPIFGGLHGDVPIAEDQGEAVGKIIAGGVSAVVDVSEMEGKEQRRFTLDFIRALRKKPRGRVHFVVDEADEFAAQTAIDANGFALNEQMTWIAKRGRYAGFILTVITQRTADISWAVLSQSQTIIVHNLFAPNDLAVVDKYLKANASKEQRAQVMASVPELDIGERWIYSPRLKILDKARTPLPTTFDSSAAPKDGETPLEPKLLAQIDLGKIRELLAPPKPETIEVDAPTPDFETGRVIDKLREDLEAALTDAQHWRGMAVARKGQLDRIALITFEKMIGDDRDPTNDWVDFEISSFDPVPRPIPRAPSYVHEAAEIKFHEEVPAKPGDVSEPMPAAAEALHVPGMGTIPPRWQKILDAVAWGQMLLKMDAVDRGIIAWVNGNSPRSSGFQNDLGAMRTRGLLRYPAGGVVALTEAGANLANKPKSAPTKAQLFDMVKQSLEPRFCKILDTVYGYKRASRGMIAEHLGLSEKSSGFQNDLGKLRTLGLLEYPEAGYVSLGKILA